MSKKLIVSCAVIIIAACLILSIISILFASNMLLQKEDQLQNSIIPSTEVSQFNQTPVETSESSTLNESTITPESINLTPSATSIPEPTPTDVIDPFILSQLVLIEQQVSEERGIFLENQVARNIFTSEQLTDYVYNDFANEYSVDEAFTDTITLSAFGLLDIDFDIYNFYLELLNEQIAGLYDNDTKEMIIVQSEEFGGPEKLTYAHEFTHALQDSAYDIEDGLNFNDDACALDTDRCAAVQALIEGDATFSELNWFILNATPEDRLSIMDFYNTFESPILESGPGFIQLDLLFPYEAGYTFVEHQFNSGGWSAVDAVYGNPPVSTEQIIHPEKYPDDTPLQVILPELTDILEEDWLEIDRNVLGEWYTYLVLAFGLDEEFRISEEKAKIATSGWGGDKYVVFWNPVIEKFLMVLRTAWDSEADAAEFSDSLSQYLSKRVNSNATRQDAYKVWKGTEYLHGVSISSTETIWLISPDENILKSLIQQLDIES